MQLILGLKSNVRIEQKKTHSLKMGLRVAITLHQQTKNQIISLVPQNYIIERTFENYFGYLLVIFLIFFYCFTMLLTLASIIFFSDKTEGLLNIKSSPEPVLGKAITSLIEFFFSNIIISLSTPQAIPP